MIAPLSRSTSSTTRVAAFALLVLVAVTAVSAQSSRPANDVKAALRGCALLEDERLFDESKFRDLLAHRDATVRSRAALALSRIQHAGAVPMLVAALADEDSAVRCDAAFALGQTPSEDGARALERVLEGKDAALRATAAEALGKIAGAIGGGLQPLLKALEGEEDARVRGELVLALWRGGFATEAPGREVLLERIDDPSPAVHWRAVYSLVRAETRGVGPALDKVLVAPPRDADGLGRLFAARGLANDGAFPIGAESAASASLYVVLRAMHLGPFDTQRDRLATEILHALARIDATSHPLGMVADSTWLLRRTDLSASLRYRAVEWFETLTNRQLRDDVDGQASAVAEAIRDSLVARLALTQCAWLDASPWVRARALAALVPSADHDELARIADRALAADGGIADREAFVTSLAARGAEEALPFLERAFAFEDPRTRTAVAEAIRHFEGRDTAHDLARRALAIDDLAIRGAAVLSVGTWEDPAWSETLEKVYENSSRFDLTEVRASVVRALAALPKTPLAFFERALEDPEPMVRRAAAVAIEARSDREVPLAAIQRDEANDEAIAAIELGIDQRVVFETTRGEFEVTLYPEAPLQARALIDRARRGFYDGLPFHRIVPNFVVQGGDPRGDGWGGLDTFVREQWSRRRFDTGVVGMPTAGKDTGGCQIFVALIPTPHLDGRYTAFGEISSGMDVVRRLEKGDRILSTSLRR